MASEPKRAKADLIVRVRYSNPLPPPPFPPRLSHISTTPSRYTTYDFLTPINNEKELPMMLDNELGLPMELGKIRAGDCGDGEYWNGSRSMIAPTGQPPEPNEADAFLLGDSIASMTPGLLTSSAAAVVDRKKIEVSWLRRTEYLSSEISSKSIGTGGFGTVIVPEEEEPELALSSRQELISQTFTSLHSLPLTELRHPTKKHLRAVDSWEVYPDENLWGTLYNLARFGEDPGEAKIEKVQSNQFVAPRVGADVRLPRAIFRPVDIPGETGRIGYYLPETEETALAYEERRRVGAEDADPEEAFDFRHVRDYEVATSRELAREYVLSFADEVGAEESNGHAEGSRSNKRAKGVYYAPLGAAQTLRKRRPRRNEDPTAFPQAMVDDGVSFWHGMNVSVRPVNEVLPSELQDDRNAVLDEVLRPTVRMEVDPEDEAEVEIVEAGEV